MSHDCRELTGLPTGRLAAVTCLLILKTMEPLEFSLVESSDLVALLDDASRAHAGCRRADVLLARIDDLRDEIALRHANLTQQIAATQQLSKALDEAAQELRLPLDESLFSERRSEGHRYEADPDDAGQCVRKGEKQVALDEPIRHPEEKSRDHQHEVADRSRSPNRAGLPAPRPSVFRTEAGPGSTAIQLAERTLRSDLARRK